MPRSPHGRAVPKRSVILDGYRTSVTVEDAFWAAVKDIAAAQGTTISQLIAAIDSERRKRQHINLSSAIRLFCARLLPQQNAALTAGTASMPKRPKGPSPVLKRSIRFDGHRTSVTLEDAFWTAFKEIAAAQGITIGQLAATIDTERHERQQANLASAIRLFVLDYYRSRVRP
jgi:predicted DNA-binding ribbon-helix-helix protein